MISFVFPGQGSQRVGMGKDIYHSFAIARQVFEAVNDALHLPLSKVIFEGPQELLNRTDYAQPALMCVCMAIWRVLQQEYGVDRSPVGACAGHSLGEYSALTATQALALSDSALLLHIRGRAMHQALPEGAGAMAAVLNMTPQTLQPLIDTLNQPDCVCELANDNGPGQCHCFRAPTGSCGPAGSFARKNNQDA